MDTHNMFKPAELQTSESTATELSPNEEVKTISYKYSELNPRITVELAREIALGYENLVHNPNEPAVHRAYTALQQETLAQYRFAKDHGYRFVAYEGEGQPYQRGIDLFTDIRYNKTVQYFPTRRGFGPPDMPRHEDHPMLEEADGMVYNDIFRAIHDLYGHAAGGHDIIADGEFAAFRRHLRMFTEEAMPALFIETVAQAAWLEVGPHRKYATDPYVYPPQKAGLLPEVDYVRFMAHFRSDCRHS